MKHRTNTSTIFLAACTPEERFKLRNDLQPVRPPPCDVMYRNIISCPFPFAKNESEKRDKRKGRKDREAQKVSVCSGSMVCLRGRDLGAPLDECAATAGGLFYT